MTHPPIEANSRELRLARRALRAAQTHLRNAVGLVSMSMETAEAVRRQAIGLELEIEATRRFERDANEHLTAMVKRRRGA